jgi:hypothetical protein
MMRPTIAFFVLAVALTLALSACATTHSSVATVNIATIEQRWPKFINYSRQLQANYYAINASKISVFFLLLLRCFGKVKPPSTTRACSGTTLMACKYEGNAGRCRKGSTEA